MFERFTDKGRKIIILAREEAERHQNDYLGTEHLVLAILRESDGIALMILKKMGLSPEQIRLEIERNLPGGGTTMRLTSDPGFDDISVWSPDSARIAFNSSRDNPGGTLNAIYERAANGTGSDKRLFSASPGELLVPFDWSSDGRWLVFGRAGPARSQRRRAAHRAYPLRC